jgi:hypothetical protein
MPCAQAAHLQYILTTTTRAKPHNWGWAIVSPGRNLTVRGGIVPLYACNACCAVYYSLVERIARMLSLPHGATERRVCTVTITTAHKHNQPSQSRQLSCRPDKAHAAPSLLEAPALFTYGALNPYARNHDRSTLWKMQPTQWEDQQTLSPPNGRINGPSIHRMEGPIDTLSTNPIHHMLPMPDGASSDDILCMPGTSDIRPLIASVRARVGGRERGGQNTRLFASEG